ncbi:hypothetical protein [Dechloromonas sp. A34]|uniref:hypothetical protein n=1 Tax=Dechloromonas sp. A34 TaxID=447588 RepID=UPI00224910FD|nr:hypothetical protein [Dechloromonas sp. A34]
MPRALSYLATGFLIALAIVIGIYSKISSIICLLLAYGFFRFGRHGLEGLTSLVGNHSEPDSGVDEIEIIHESENELTVRGSDRVLILDRGHRTISGLHSKIAPYDQVRHILIHQQLNSTDDAGMGRYSVVLSLGIMKSIHVGHTNSQINASIVAAKLSTWTGKPVVA